MVGKDRADRRRDTGRRPRVKDQGQVRVRDRARSKGRDQASGQDQVRGRDQVRVVEDSMGYVLRLTTTS